MNQKKLGVIANDAKLEPWPADLITPWDPLTPDPKRLFIRQVEAVVAYAAYSDYEIGRVIQRFDDLGKLDNTLIINININGDNGISAEGGPLGTPMRWPSSRVSTNCRWRCNPGSTTSGAPIRPTTRCWQAGPGPSTPPSVGSSRTPPGSVA